MAATAVETVVATDCLAAATAVDTVAAITVAPAVATMVAVEAREPTAGKRISAMASTTFKLTLSLSSATMATSSRSAPTLTPETTRESSPSASLMTPMRSHKLVDFFTCPRLPGPTRPKFGATSRAPTTPA